ncbi:MAG TPA: FAD-binding oxidoreductase, partial [Armatimonadetes bacterium]|nr:FAD-binding oxidoreductase [Armatimonadota bacterium]
IGSGIIGASCAYFLARNGMRVHVLEAQSTVCAGTSRACDGLVLVWDKPLDATFKFAQFSANLWRELADELPIPFDYAQPGCLVIAESNEAFEQAKMLSQRMHQLGEACQMVEGQDLRAFAPHLSHDVRGAIYLPSEAQVEPRKATVALLRGAMEYGAHISIDAPALDFQLRNSRIVAVRTPRGNLSCSAVVIAAGVWTPILLTKLGMPSLPLRPRKGHVLVLERTYNIAPCPMLEVSYTSAVQSCNSNSTDDDGAQIAFVLEPTVEQTVLLGSSRQFVGMNMDVDLRIAQAIASRAVRFVPTLSSQLLLRIYVGLRPWTPDGMPIISPFDDVDGIYIATGHEGSGICMAPATGWLIAKMMQGDELPDYAKAFTINRFIN